MNARGQWPMFLRAALIFRLAATAGLGLAVTTSEVIAQVMPARTTATVNMRVGPGIQYRLILSIPVNRTVQVLGCTRTVIWCHIRYRSREGWVSARYLLPRPRLGSVIPPFPPPHPGPLPPPGPGPLPLPGAVTVVGTLTNEGVECQAMRGDNGQLYTLAGNTGPFRSGDRVRVLGQFAQMSFCMQGTTISVQAIQPAF